MLWGGGGGVHRAVLKSACEEGFGSELSSNKAYVLDGISGAFMLEAAERVGLAAWPGCLLGWQGDERKYC